MGKMKEAVIISPLPACLGTYSLDMLDRLSVLTSVSDAKPYTCSRFSSTTEGRFTCLTCTVHACLPALVKITPVWVHVHVSANPQV